MAPNGVKIEEIRIFVRSTKIMIYIYCFPIPQFNFVPPKYVKAPFSERFEMIFGFTPKYSISPQNTPGEFLILTINYYGKKLKSRFLA